MIWSESYLNNLGNEAEAEINSLVPCIYHRFFLATTSGTSVYTFPEKVRSVLRITWRGEKVNPISWQDMMELSPGTFVVSAGTRLEHSTGKPLYWALHPSNLRNIRFYPTPNETFVDTEDASNDPYKPNTNARCTISCWRHVDTSTTTAIIPGYVARRMKKAYVLWKAFEKDGKGQNLRAADFYKKKFNFMIENFRLVNSGTFVSKRPNLGEDLMLGGAYRHPRPILPSRYERVIY